MRSDPPGAHIELCGRKTRRRTPAVLRLRAGRRCKLRLRLDGHAMYMVPVTGAKGAPLTVTARLRPEGESSSAATPQKRAVETGTLIVTSIRVGTVYVNNEAVGQTPKLELRIATGRYTVWMRFPSLGVQTGTKTINLEADQRLRLHFDPTM